jgi:hypothetical protein
MQNPNVDFNDPTEYQGNRLSDHRDSVYAKRAVYR